MSTTIKSLTHDELKSIYRRHISADFPRGERRPFFAMEKMMGDGKYQCYGCFDSDGGLMAYACYILAGGGKYALLDYFAVVSELRGQGVGSEFLRNLRPYVPAKVGTFIEAESVESAKTDEEKSVRERRIKFYLSNGAELTDSNCALFGVDYSILFIPVGERPCDMHAAVTELYRELYGRVYGRLCRPYTV